MHTYTPFSPSYQKLQTTLPSPYHETPCTSIRTFSQLLHLGNQQNSNRWTQWHVIDNIASKHSQRRRACTKTHTKNTIMRAHVTERAYVPKLTNTKRKRPSKLVWRHIASIMSTWHIFCVEFSARSSMCWFLHNKNTSCMHMSHDAFDFHSLCYLWIQYVWWYREVVNMSIINNSISYMVDAEIVCYLWIQYVWWYREVVTMSIIINSVWHIFDVCRGIWHHSKHVQHVRCLNK